MIKKIVLLFVAGLIQWCAIGQTVYYTDPLNSSSGWQYDGNWTFSAGKFVFNYAPVTLNYDFTGISPEINLVANTQNIIIKQHLDVWSSATTNEKAEIYLIENGTEHLLWQHSLSSGTWGSIGGADLVLPVSTYAGQNVKLKFRTYGATTDAWNSWDVYEFSLIAQFANDLSIQQITGPKHLNPQQSGNWKVQLKNLGTQDVNGFVLKLKNRKTNATVVEINDATVIGTGNEKMVDLSWTPDTIFNTVLYADVEIQNDEYTGNNRSKGAFLRSFPPNYLNIYLWDKDNDIGTIEDPETNEIIQPDEALSKVMDSVGMVYEKGTILPEFVEDYDVIFVTTGPYCYS